MTDLISRMENTADQVPGASAVPDRAVYELKRLMEENERLVKEMELLLASKTVPKGWCLVPVEMTYNMLSALTLGSATDSPNRHPIKHWQDRYAAMLAVAPMAPQEPRHD